MITIATMGRFAGQVPRSWDKGTSSGAFETRYVDKKLPSVTLRNVDKKEKKININVVRSEVAAVKNKRWHDTFIEKIDTATNELNRLA